MMYECLITPSEHPNSLLEIKRALLTYDKVKLVDPNDRDVIPSNAFLNTIIGFPLGMSMGAVRPMGKVLGYDERFERIAEKCKPAINQGLLEIISTYDITETEGKLTLGGVNVGGYPLDTRFVFDIYRKICQDQHFLTGAISGNIKELLDNSTLTEGLSMEGQGDSAMFGLPALPLIESPNLSQDQAKCLTQIARARIASMIKYAGFCEMKNLVPIFNGTVYGNIVAKLLNNANSVLSEVEEDKYWLKRNRILELCHEEFLDEVALNSMSIEQVIKMRTRVWGKQAEARESLFSSINKMALEIDDRSLFQKKSIESISNYRKDSESLIRERANLSLKIICEMGKATIKGSCAFGGLSQISSPLTSMSLTLAAGGIWVFDKSKEYIPKLRQLKSQEAELKRGAGFGLHEFYSQINRGGQ